MTAIRTVAVGLAMATYLIIHYAQDFARWAMSSQELYVFEMAVRSLSPNAAAVVGNGVFLPGVFLLGCLSAGLFAATFVWPFVEDSFSGAAQLFAKSVAKPLVALFAKI